MTSTRTDLSTHVSLLLQQQKRLRELYSELTAQPVSSNAINTNTTRLKTRGELRIAQERCLFTLCLPVSAHHTCVYAEIFFLMLNNLL